MYLPPFTSSDERLYSKVKRYIPEYDCVPCPAGDATNSTVVTDSKKEGEFYVDE